MRSVTWAFFIQLQVFFYFLLVSGTLTVLSKDIIRTLLQMELKMSFNS